jgi:hypothetical protein
MSRLNGIGTTYYGRSDVRPDGSYVATEWFVILLLPIYPLSTYRLWEGKTDSSFYLIFWQSSTSYQRQKVERDWPQIRNTLFIAYVVIPAAIIAFSGLFVNLAMLLVVPVVGGLWVALRWRKLRYKFLVKKETVTCGFCGQLLRVPRDRKGYTINCSNCHAPLFKKA